MPASAQPELDLSPYTQHFGPELKKAWHESVNNCGDRTTWCDFYVFVIQRKELFLKEHGSDKIYRQFLEGLWGSFSKSEINTAKYFGQTMLMRTVQLTQDPDTVLFAIERTSDSGINIRSPQPVIGEHYALLSALNHKLKLCLEPLISRSNSITVLESAKEGLASFGRMKTRFKDRPCSLKDAYTPEEIAYYTNKIDQRISKLKWSRLPVFGGMLRKALVPEVNFERPKSLSSEALSSSTPDAKIASQASAVSHQAKLQVVHS